jgi:hemolysin activation/secretion protein
LAGIDAVRGYPYRLQLLGDRLLGGTLSLRVPVLRDVRADLPGRYFGLRSFHLAPFVDSAWAWNRDQSITDVSPRTSAGLRLIAGLGFASLLRFEVVADLAVPVDTRGRQEDAGVQAWIRLQSTAGGGLH